MDVLMFQGLETYESEDAANPWYHYRYLVVEIAAGSTPDRIWA